jgi:hypothetical protein
LPFDVRACPGPRGLDMENLVEVLVAFVLIFSVFLLYLSYRSYQVTGSRKMFFVMGAFVLFLLKGIIESIALFTDAIELKLEPALVLIDLFILITLYIMIIKK